MADGMDEASQQQKLQADKDHGEIPKPRTNKIMKATVVGVGTLLSVFKKRRSSTEVDSKQPSEVDGRGIFPCITKDPDDISVFTGKPAVFTCTVHGDPSPSIQWIHKDSPISQSERITIIRLKDQSILTLSEVVEEDEGEYYCTASNSKGVAKSSIALLHIECISPNIIKDPEDTSASPGKPAVFTCTVHSDPAPSIEWIHKGSPISQSERITIHWFNHRSTLTLSGVVEEDEGEYYCRASTSAGVTESTSAFLHIDRIGPSIIRNPRSTSASPGNPAVFTCTVNGDPSPSIEWIHKGSPISQSERITIMRANDRCILTLLEVVEEDEGEYYCRASNSAGVTKSTTAFLQIEGISPSIIKNPWSTSASPGNPAVFTCTVNGDPSPSIEWTHKGSPISQSERITISMVNNKSILNILEVVEEDEGEYYCRASNSKGMAKSTTAFLHIEGIFPNFIKNPEDINAYIGKPEEFTMTMTPSASEVIIIEEDEGEYSGSASTSAGMTKSTNDYLHIEIECGGGGEQVPQRASHVDGGGEQVLPHTASHGDGGEHSTVDGDDMESTINKKAQVDAVVELFKITKEGMANIADRLTKCFNKGLERDGEVLKMLPTYIHSLPDGSEEGDFLALDFGGSTLRIIHIAIKGGKVTEMEEKYEMESALQGVTQEKLFDYIAECLSHFVNKKNITKRLPLGFTIAFPVLQRSLTSGTLLQWTKGFKVSGAKGLDIVKLLMDAIQRRGDVEIDVVALVNDTTGTQMAVGLKDPNCHVGLILGLGFNVCYMEKLDAVKKFSGNRSKHSTMIISSELGAFGNGGELKPWLTEFDRELNTHSLHPGQQTFEKMISYMYLGEIAKLAMQKLIQEKALFRGKSSHKFEKFQSFGTDFIITIARGENAECKKIFKDEFGIDATDTDCEMVRRVCDAVTKRSARLAGSGVVALVRKINKTDCCTVAVDGSLYKQHPTFPAMMQEAMDELHPGNRIVMKLSMDGSGRGAAVVAAVATRLEAGIPPSIIKNPENSSASIGKPAVFTCTVHGDPFPSIEWTHKDSPIIESERITISRANDQCILTLSEVVEEDEGEYYCRASNSAGVTKSTTAFLQIESSTLGRQDEQVDFPKLTGFTKSNRQRINIAEEIQPERSQQICAELLNDRTGNKFEAIQRKHAPGTDINSEILRKWVNETPREQRTWRRLVQVLMNNECIRLGEEIEDVVGKCYEKTMLGLL